MSAAAGEINPPKVKAAWTSAPLRSLCEFHNGLWKGKKGPFETATVIRNTNFTLDGRIDLSDVAVLEVEARQLAKRRLQKNDIIIEKSGGGPKQPVGRVVLFDLDVDEKYSFSNFTSAIRVVKPSEIDPAFLHRVLYWWYTSGRTEVIQSHSTGIRNLDFNAYKDLVVPLPPLEEQKRIVAILDQAFAALDRARALAEANLTDAIELKKRSVEYELSADVLGPLEAVGPHVNLLTGFAFKSSGYSDAPDDVRLIRGDNIVQGTFRWDGVKRWPAVDREIYRKYELALGDVLIAMDRTWVSAGIKYAIVDEATLPSLLVQRVARLRAMQSIVPRYLGYWIGSAVFEKYILSIQTGLGVPHVSGSQIEAFQIRVPSVETQEAIVDRLDAVVERCDGLISMYQQKLTDLSNLRQSLLQKAFSGQLT